MKQENEMDRTGPHSEFSELEIYLQECDFSRLRERDWHRIGPRTLGIILSHRPELYEICRNLITLQPESWSELLQVRPDLAEECDCWEKFPAVELVRILKKQPQLARYVLNWKTMNEPAWSLLLLHHPELAEYCPYWIDFRLAASWIGESVIAAHQEHAEQLQRNVPWAPAITENKQ